MGNIKATLQGGLQNDYGIFNLNADMLHYIKVDIITNGGQYVESQEADFQHGSTNGLRDHEGIKPIDFATPNWDTYGPVLATKLTNYFADRINSMATQELWENYSVYGNQFSLEFDIIEGQDDSTYQNVNFSYPSYSNENIDFNGRKYRTYTLSTLYSSGVEMKAYIIHFSKYYYVYNTVSGSQQTLRPLLYYTEDLDTYNMGIYEQTESGSTDSIGIPYVKTLLGIEWYRHKSGWHRCEEIFHSVRSFDTTARVNAAGTGAITGGYGAWNKFCSDEESSGSGHDWSMFASNPADRPTFENYSAKQWASIPEGFSLWGLGGGHEYYINNKNEGHLDDTTKLPNSYTSVFNPQSVKRRRTSREGGHVHGSSGGNDSFIGVMFRLDKNSNHHIFNTYFPVWGNDFNNGNISQVIKYKGSNPSYPKYVGMILASILTSIYVYGDEPSGTIKYVQDVVYLQDHSTIYTKDVVYRAYVEFGQGSANTSNDLLLMHKSNYKEYVERLKTFITTSEDDPTNYDDPDKVFNDNKSSLSKQFTYSPSTNFNAKLRAVAGPPFSFDKTRIFSGYNC